MAIHGNSHVRAHNGTDGTAGAFRGFFFNNYGRGIPHLIDMRCQADDSLGADEDAERASLAPFCIDNDIS